MLYQISNKLVLMTWTDNDIDNDNDNDGHDASMLATSLLPFRGTNFAQFLLGWVMPASQCVCAWYKQEVQASK